MVREIPPISPLASRMMGWIPVRRRSSKAAVSPAGPAPMMIARCFNSDPHVAMTAKPTLRLPEGRISSRLLRSDRAPTRTAQPACWRAEEVLREHGATEDTAKRQQGTKASERTTSPPRTVVRPRVGPSRTQGSKRDLSDRSPRTPTRLCPPQRAPCRHGARIHPVSSRRAYPAPCAGSPASAAARRTPGRSPR